MKFQFNPSGPEALWAGGRNPQPVEAKISLAVKQQRDNAQPATSIQKSVTRNQYPG